MKNGTLGETRTHTLLVLSQLSLPIGVREHLKMVLDQPTAHCLITDKKMMGLGTSPIYTPSSH